MSSVPRNKKSGTIGWLADLYFRDGAGSVERYVKQRLEPGNHERVSAGRPSQRTDVREDEGIHYEDYSPTLWEVPYTILRARFEPGHEKTDYIYHSGEEVLVPIGDGGEVQYHYYWGPEKESPKMRLLKPVKPGNLIRINPQIPHHTWAKGKHAVTAWMIFRHESDTPNAISLTAQPSVGGELRINPRQVTDAQLQDSAKYALIAWGIAEKIRLLRGRANLTIAQLSQGCGVDSSQLSRLENADANLPIETIIGIAKFLRMDLTDLIGRFPKFDEGEDEFALDLKKAKREERLTKEKGPHHHMKFVEWAIPKGQVSPDSSNVSAELTSWIVLEGTAKFEVEKGPESRHEYVDAGHVIHFCKVAPSAVHALDDTRILQISYSPQEVPNSKSNNRHRER